VHQITITDRCAAFVSQYIFRAKTATTSARLSHRNSVCPLVRPSVCLSHGWISKKRCKLRSPRDVVSFETSRPRDDLETY